MGMMVSYTTWLLHGELSQPDEQDDCEDEYNEDGGDEYEQLIEDHYKGTYMGSDTIEREAVSDFENLVEAAQRGLYPGCKKSNTLLAFVIEMLQVKVESGWSNHSFNKFLLKMRKFYPEGNVIPESINECKNLLRDLDLGYELIHACPNDCVLFWKENAQLEKCPNPKCQSSRYKINDSKGRKIPQKILHYIPLTPRLKRLYMTSEIAKDMRWHSDKRVDNEDMEHPADTPHWKVFDHRNPEFSKETRNVRLGKNWRVVELVRHRGVWDVPEQDELPHDPFQQDETEDGGVQINIEDFEVQHYKDNATSEIITVDEHMVVQVDGQDNEDDMMVRYVDEENVDFSKLHDSDADSDVDYDV